MSDLHPAVVRRWCHHALPAALWLVATGTGLCGAQAPAADNAPGATSSPTDAAADAPVAVVNGTAITLRQVENALLKKEGSDGLTDWVQSHLAKLDWTKIKDSDIILSIAGINLTRRDLVMQLLKPADANGGYAGSGGKAREDLIDTELVTNAIISAHIVIDQQALDATWATMEEQFNEGQKGSKDRIEFSSFIKTKEGMDVEEFRRQPGFLMLAGLRKLAIKQGMENLVEADVMTYFDAHRDRWDVQPAVKLADIYLPYQNASPEEKVRVMSMALNNYQNLRTNPGDFDKIWEWLGKVWDPAAGPGGDIGWVSASGARADAEARLLPAAIMQKAFAAKQLPQLLQPVASDKGVDLVRVDAQRPGVEVIYKDVRDQVAVDMITDQLQERMTEIMNQLRREAKIQYLSLPDAVERMAATPP